MRRILACSAVFALLFAADRAWAHDPDVIVQYSTLDALKAGLYDGEMTYGEMAEYGDFGLGTFNALDGEMVGFDGQFWRITDDGAVSAVTPDTKTPFAVVTFFDDKIVFDLPEETDFAALSTVLSSHVAGANTPVAVRITGSFTALTVRAPRLQQEPYLPLDQALADQAVWQLEEVSGTMAGYWFPAWLGNINAAVWHLHFLSDDRDQGGHVVDMVTGSGTVSLDPTPRLTLLLPQTPAFDGAKLSGD